MSVQFGATARAAFMRSRFQGLRFRCDQTTRRFISNKPPGTARQASTTASNVSSQRIFSRLRGAFVEPAIYVFRAYGRMFERSPYLTQLSTTMSIYFVGDLSAQMIAKTPDSQYEPIRGMNAMIVGGVAAIPSYRWFLFLSKTWNYASWPLTMGIKIAALQFVFTPIFSSYFFAMHSFLTGGTLQDMKKRAMEGMPVTWWNSWKVWPAVTIINFTYVPLVYRSVVAGGVAICWQTYLAWLNQKAHTADSLKGDTPGKMIEEGEERLSRKKAAPAG